jgi:diguanylate cyclase (GGDEF)-like protein
MNMNHLRKILPPANHDPVENRSATATTDELSHLSREADALLRKLVRLRQSLTDIRRATREASVTPRIAEANEPLLLAALHAEAVAETAVSKLGELARSSLHDALTGLPNRLLMFDRLANAIAAAARRETRIAVLFIDLDNFKRINDTMGHATGDEVLKLAARRLRAVLRSSDTVSRHGGEEFLVLLPEVADAVDAAQLAQKLLSALAAPARVGGHRLSLSASIGIAMYPEDGEDPNVLVDRADAAMYRSKRRGPGGFEFFAQKLSMRKRASGPHEK